MITATERADWMALQIFIASRANHDVITHDLVDAVMSRDADKEQGKANKEMVRRIIRKRAASESVRVIFTEDERYWAIREQLHAMTTDEVHALRDEIAEGGDDDPRGWDPVLTKAISVRLSHRQQTRRLWNCKPVSIRLWREPRRPAVEETAPAAPDTARLFTALAAYESFAYASLGVTPRELDTLAAHLTALRPAAPTDLQAELVDAQADIDDAREALRTTRSLTGRNAAWDRARAAVQRAGAAILAIEPHAKQMHGTDMPATAADIRAAALAYNAVEGTPEELSAIATGMVSVRVHCRSDSGTGWTVTATITAGVDSPMGHITAHPPILVKFRKRDGRDAAAENFRKMFGRLFRISVPVYYVTDHRP
ncbi:hypothetical protein M2271_007214 [Streptomyces sp. LBL]|uniref:hypothetical protein n=1 Tax=Streptomyces sp. LBL TaxID=2940562 RepID=UPI002474A129|nr:hypothetical protein [Streptomyces sp. LBL]MDH6629378.1 hypothetical protein [Streptomyces sp. LBL]